MSGRRAAFTELHKSDSQAATALTFERRKRRLR